MRCILLASPLLFTVIFTASASNGQNLVSASALAIDPPFNSDATASTVDRPASTGVIPPTIVQTVKVPLPFDFASRFPDDAEVVLELNLDESGNPQDIQVLQSVDPDLDAGVVEAVHQFRWLPATLNNQPIPYDLTLNVVVHR